MLLEGPFVTWDAEKVLGWSEVRQGATISIQAQEQKAQPPHSRLCANCLLSGTLILMRTGSRRGSLSAWGLTAGTQAPVEKKNSPPENQLIIMEG